MVVAFDEQHVGAEPRGSDGGGGAGRAAAHDQHVAFGKHRNLAGRLAKCLLRPRPPDASVVLEQHDALLFGQVAAVVLLARARGCCGRAIGRLGVLVVGHALSLVLAGAIRSGRARSPKRQRRAADLVPVASPRACGLDPQGAFASAGRENRAAYFDFASSPFFTPASGNTHIEATIKTATTMTNVEYSARIGDPLQ